MCHEWRPPGTDTCHSPVKGLAGPHPPPLSFSSLLKSPSPLGPNYLRRSYSNDVLKERKHARSFIEGTNQTQEKLSVRVPSGSSSVIRTGDPNVIDESSKPDRHLTLVRPETLEATYPVTWFSMGIWKGGRRVVAPGVGFEPTRPKGPQANSRPDFPGLGLLHRRLPGTRLRNPGSEGCLPTHYFHLWETG